MLEYSDMTTHAEDFSIQKDIFFLQSVGFLFPQQLPPPRLLLLAVTDGSLVALWERSGASGVEVEIM